MTLEFGICGILGGLLMAVGDVLLDLKGRDDTERGHLGILHSAWDHMNEKRFLASILLALVGTPLQALGFTALAQQLAIKNPGYALGFWLVALVGMCGSFFIHTILCLFPVLYRDLKQRMDLENTQNAIEHLYRAIAIPFWVQYLCLVLVPGILTIIAICLGYLPLSKWFCLVNAPVFTVIGLLLRKIKPDWFCDLPGIVMPSLGVGSVGLLAILCL